MLYVLSFNNALLYYHIIPTLCYQVAELGQILFNFTNLVPDGIVVFLPSYAFLNTVKKQWETSGMLSKFTAKKVVCNVCPECPDHCLMLVRCCSSRRMVEVLTVF
jgi:hypothetical protein